MESKQDLRKQDLGINLGGRPPVENPKIKTLAYKVSEIEYQKLKENAQGRGLSISSFARKAALSKDMPRAIKPKVDLSTFTELGRIGNNLNQITKHLHESGDRSGLDKTISELLNQIDQIRSELMGL